MPHPADEPLDVLLGRVLRTLRHRWSQELAAHDLAPHQGRALRIVAETGPLRLSALAERLRITPRSVTEVADALEQRDLIARSPDPGDRRATLLAVTDTGREVATAYERVRRAQSEAFFGRLSVGDRHALTRILTDLVDD